MNSFIKNTGGFINYKDVNWREYTLTRLAGDIISCKIFYKGVLLFSGNPKYKKLYPINNTYTIEQIILYIIFRAFDNTPDTKVIYTNCFNLFT